MHFVTLVATKERSAILYPIVSSYINEYNNYAGIIDIEVRTAKNLSEKQTKELQKVLEKTTSKKVNLFQTSADLKVDC